MRTGPIRAALALALPALALSAGCQKHHHDHFTAEEPVDPESDLADLVLPGPAAIEIDSPQVTATFTVRNEGPADAGPFNVAVRVEEEEGSRRIIQVEGLSAGAEKQLTAILPRGGDCGACRLCIVLDSNGNVPETGEENESCQPLPLPDLVVSGIAPPQWESRGCRERCLVRVPFTVKNAGDLAAGAFRVSFNSPHWEEALVAGLAPGEERSLVAEPASGGCPDADLDFCIDLDSGREILESDEGNNGACKRRELPDLTAGEIQTAAGECEGLPCTRVTFTLTNQGPGASEACAFRVKVKRRCADPGEVIAHTGAVEALAPGGSSPIEVFLPPSLGAPPCSVCVDLDFADCVLESEETNNTSCRTGTDPALPDLMVERIDEPLRESRGCNRRCYTEAGFVVRNAGNAPSGPFKIAFTPLDLAILDVPALEAGESAPLTASISTEDRCPNADEPLCVIIDPEGAVLELDEENNRLCRSRKLPDLAASELAIEVVNCTDSPAGDLQCTKVSFAISNRGDGLSEGGRYRIPVNPDCEEEEEIALPPGEIPPLGPGETHTVVVELPSSLGLPPCSVCVEVDLEGCLLESDETNNSSCKVQPEPPRPELAVKGIGDLPWESRDCKVRCLGEVQFTIQNIGTAEARGFGVSFSPAGFQALEGLNLPAGEDLALVARPASGSCPPADEPFCVVIDGQGAVLEVDEENNTLCKSRDLPELTVPRLEVTIAPCPPGITGLECTHVSFTVTNEGPGDSEACRFSIRVAAGTPQEVVLTGEIEPLPAGESRRFDRTLPGFCAGDGCAACVEVDFEDCIREGNESDNSACDVVDDGGLPDLMVVEVSRWDITSRECEPECASDVPFRIRNAGPRAAGAFGIAFDPPHWEPIRLAGLAAGAELSLTAKRGSKSCADRTTGHRPEADLCAILDAAGEVPESAEDNNRRCRPADLPDLVVEGLVKGPCSASMGGPCTRVRFEVVNIGEARAGGSFVELKKGSEKLARKPVPALAPGERFPLDLTISRSCGSSCTLCVKVDSSGCVRESSEVNLFCEAPRSGDD